MLKMILIFLGGGIGAAIRELLVFAGLTLHGHFPSGILGANLIAAFLIGLVTVLVAKNRPVDKDIQLLVITGIMGGLSTFSTLAWGTIELWKDPGQVWIGWLYLLISMGGGLVLVELGARLGRSFESSHSLNR
jgi:CrcB protein